MQFSEELLKVLGQLHADIETDAEYEQVVESALMGIGKRRRPVLKTYLTELLSAAPDEAELEQAWWRSPADCYPLGEGGYTRFLSIILRLIDSPEVNASPIP